jgi:glutathione synthase/RimK-type ligase-like ATP-grasp enzyme
VRVRVALLMTDAPWYAGTGYAQAWGQALQEQGAEVERLTGLPASWADGGPPVGLDLVVPHVLVEEVAAFAPTLRAAGVLECAGVPLLNSVVSLLTSSDKLATAAVWAAAGLPQPATWDLDQVGRWPLLGRPLVLKPALCDGARHIALVHDLDEADALVRAWRDDEARGGERRGSALLQEWVEEPACVRLFATPDRVSLAYEKGRAPGELVTSGTVYPRVYEPPPVMAELARRMVATLGGGLMGVDVLVDREGRHLALEANAPFGFDVTDPAQGRWVATAALDHARRRRRAA